MNKINEPTIILSKEQLTESKPTYPSWIPSKKVLLPGQIPNFDLSDYSTVNCAICARYKQESRILILITDYKKYKHLHDWPMCDNCFHTAAMQTATEPPQFHFPAGLTTYLNSVSNNGVSRHTEFFDQMTKAQQIRSTKNQWISPEYGEREQDQTRSPMYYMTRHELLMERSRQIEEKEKQSKNVINANASVIQQWMSQQQIEQDPVKYAKMIAMLFEGKEMKRETNRETKRETIQEYNLTEIDYYREPTVPLYEPSL
jgi:hypothetical protein